MRVLGSAGDEPFDDAEDRSTSSCALGSWLEDRVASLLEEQEQDDDAPEPAPAAHFEPALAVPAVRVIRMRHPTFGAGEVLRSLEDGTKYEIAFSVGTKVLLARFVKPCE